MTICLRWLWLLKLPILNKITNYSPKVLQLLFLQILLQMDPHASMAGLDMLGSPHSDGVSSGHSMSSTLPMSSAVSVDPHSHSAAQLAVNAAAHHSAMYGHGHSAATSMMSPHTSLGHPHLSLIHI